MLERLPTSQPIADEAERAGAGGPWQAFAARLRSFVRAREVLLVPLAMAVGSLAGLAVVAMSWGSQMAHVVIYGIPLDLRLSADSAVPKIAALLAPTSGGLLLGIMEWLRRRWRLAAAADPVEANALRGGRLSLRDSLVVSSQTLLSNGCGASVGLEAGYAQIGAGIASQVGQAFRLRRNDLRLMVGCGVAGAIGAAFNAPLAGALYACELVVGVYAVRSAGPVLAAALSASLLTGLFGVHPYSLHVPAGESDSALVQAIALSGLAIASGVAGIGVMHAAALVERILKRGIPDLLRPALGGLLVGGLAIYTPQVLAAGHGAMALDLGLRLTAVALLALILLKISACALSLGAGFRGGLFFASLFLGSLIGKLYAVLLAAPLLAFGIHLDPTTAALTGMAGLATAIVGAPLTMVFLVLEMTRSFEVTAAALPVCILTSVFVRATFGHSFSTWRLHLQGETISSADDVGWLRTLTVRTMMRTDVARIVEGSSIADCRARYPLGSHQAVFVCRADGTYCGLALLSDVFAGKYDPVLDVTPISEVARHQATALAPGMNAKAAMKLFEDAEADLLAVLDGAHTVIGFLTEAFAGRRYIQELDGATPTPTLQSVAKT